MSEPVAMSVSACCKLWWVTSGEFEMEPGSENWGCLWEPLDTSASPDAKPYCLLSQEIEFVEPHGQGRQRTTHYNWSACIHPQLVHVNNLWWEIGGGQVLYRNGRWHMRWSVRKNTRFANAANAAMTAYKEQ